MSASIEIQYRHKYSRIPESTILTRFRVSTTMQFWEKTSSTTTLLATWIPNSGGERLV